MGIKSQVRTNQRKMSLLLLIIWDNGLKWKEFYSCPSKLRCSFQKANLLTLTQWKGKYKNDRVYCLMLSSKLAKGPFKTLLIKFWSNGRFRYGFNCRQSLFFSLITVYCFHQKNFFMGMFLIIIVPFWLWWYTISQKCGKWKWRQKWSTAKATV